MAVPPPSTDKTMLRAMLRAARRRFVEALGPAGRAEAEAEIHAKLAAVPARAGTLAGYVATGGEPSVAAALGEAAEAGRPLALPHIGTDRLMSFASWRRGDTLARGPLRIAQPASAGDVVPSVLLVPLLGFDRHGARLGQGAGYYDRWFAANPGALRIGVAWSVQEVATLPVDPWDMPLHAIATEQEWITP